MTSDPHTQKLLRATRRVLKTPDGERLLALLDSFYQPDAPAFQAHRPDQAMDPFRAAVRDGQADVINFLRTQARSQITEDDDE